MPFFRCIARPLSFLALLALVAPGWVECCPLGAAPAHAQMSCCTDTNAAQGKLDAGCCSVDRTTKSQQPPATPVGTHHIAAPSDTPADVVASTTPDTAAALGAIAMNPGGPAPPLYLRLSAIRR